MPTALRGANPHSALLGVLLHKAAAQGELGRSWAGSALTGSAQELALS